MPLLVGAASNSATGYTLNNSLRFRSSASAYLNRLPTVAGNRKTWTWSCWVKRGKLGVTQGIMGSAQGTSTSYFDTVYFDTNDKLYCRFRIPGSGDKMYRVTTQTFRDTSAWYHLVFQYDTDGKTASPDNFKMYVNNELITSYATTYGTLTTDWESFWNGLYTQVMGRRSYTPAGTYLDGYMAEVNSVDGQALLPSDFGETDDNGTWVPKKYTGTYGTNGFYLDFEDTSSVAALGTDSSGNGNTWTVNNVSLTAGTTYDSMKDVPTLTDEDTANFATRNPLAYSPSMTFSNGNLTTNGTLASWYGAASTIFVNSGKWYWETTITVKGTYIQIGAAEEDWLPNSSVALQSNAYGYYSYNGNAVRDGASTAYGTTYTTGDVIGVALDYDNGAIWFSKNGTWQNSATISEVQAGTTTNAAFTGVTESLTPANCQYGTATQNHNYGQRAFAYTQPTGFKKLNTFNLPDSAIEDGSTNFKPVLYTGNASTQSITGLDFSPNLTWIKVRNSASYEQMWFDSVRGVTKYIRSNTTAAEGTVASTLTSFDSNGFSLGNNNDVNGSGFPIIAWNWKANGAGVSNGDGSITSTVSANPTAGFSVVTYGGNSTAGATVGHGLGIVPDMVIVKNRTGSSGFQNWGVYHSSLLNTQAVFLNTTTAVTANTTYWNNTTPTASVFSLGYTGTDGWNITGQNFVAYCFADVEGYSKFGSYTGNGSADGTFIYTGFKPKMVIIKTTSAAFDWVILDTERNPENLVHDVLYPSLANAEADATTYASFDAVANGFKLRNTHQYTNYNNYNYLYMAFAENPFKNSTAR